MKDEEKMKLAVKKTNVKDYYFKKLIFICTSLDI